MIPSHTSVPRWSRTPQDIDRTGREFLVLAFGDQVAEIMASWQGQLTERGRPVQVRAYRSADHVAVSELREHLAAARVGWRLLLAGPEVDVLAAYAVALGAGVIDAEITVCVSDDDVRRVWCPHCGADTVAATAIGGVLGCAGCARSLEVYHHVSRRTGRYLGFMADAEELP